METAEDGPVTGGSGVGDLDRDFDDRLIFSNFEKNSISNFNLGSAVGVGPETEG